MSRDPASSVPQSGPDGLMRLIEDLIDYGDHWPSCVYIYPGGRCDCGWEQTRASANAQLAALAAVPALREPEIREASFTDAELDRWPRELHELRAALYYVLDGLDLTPKVERAIDATDRLCELAAPSPAVSAAVSDTEAAVTTGVNAAWNTYPDRMVASVLAALAAVPCSREPSDQAFEAALSSMWPEPKHIGDVTHYVRPIGLRVALEAAYAVDFAAPSPAAGGGPREPMESVTGDDQRIPNAYALADEHETAGRTWTAITIRWLTAEVERLRAAHRPTEPEEGR